MAITTVQELIEFINNGVKEKNSDELSYLRSQVEYLQKERDFGVERLKKLEKEIKEIKMSLILGKKNKRIEVYDPINLCTGCRSPVNIEREAYIFAPTLFDGVFCGEKCLETTKNIRKKDFF